MNAWAASKMQVMVPAYCVIDGWAEEEGMQKGGGRAEKVYTDSWVEFFSIDWLRIPCGNLS
jgi:hypothetical protein